MPPKSAPARQAAAEQVPAWLESMFDELNQQHFGGELPRPKLAICNFGGHFGFYVPQVRMIFLHPRTIQQVPKFVADTLLHELVHYALEHRSGDHQQEHGPEFVRLANEIGTRLGLPEVDLGTDAVLEWPQSVRPADYAPWR